MAKIVLFKTPNMPEGVEVQMQKVDPRDFLPKSTYIAQIDGEDLLHCSRDQTRTATLSAGIEAIKKITKDTDVLAKLDELKADVEGRYNDTFWTEKGENVTERSREFAWFRVNADGTRQQVSLSGTDSINGSTEVAELPLSQVSKNIVQKEGTDLYILKLWAGEKKKPSSRPEAVFSRQKKMHDEAKRLSKAGTCLVDSFTYGQAFGRPTDPFFTVSYPLFRQNNEAVFLVRAAAGILPLEDSSKFPYEECVIHEPTTLVPTRPEAVLPPETLRLKAFISAAAEGKTSARVEGLVDGMKAE
jgi:hypothetical protein